MESEHEHTPGGSEEDNNSKHPGTSKVLQTRTGDVGRQGLAGLNVSVSSTKRPWQCIQYHLHDVGIDTITVLILMKPHREGQHPLISHSTSEQLDDVLSKTRSYHRFPHFRAGPLASCHPASQLMFVRWHFHTRHGVGYWGCSGTWMSAWRRVLEFL